MKENFDLRAQTSSSDAKVKTLNGLDPIIPPPPQYLAHKHSEALGQKGGNSGARTSPLRSSPTRSPSSHQRPVSMYEPREQQKVAKKWGGTDSSPSCDPSTEAERIMSRDDSGLVCVYSTLSAYFVIVSRNCHQGVWSRLIPFQGRSSHHSRQSCDYGSSEMILAGCANKYVILKTIYWH